METPNKVCIVTGAGSGIGRHVALTLLRDGYQVALAGRRQIPLEETAQLAEEASRTLVVATDVSKSEEVENLFARTQQEFGRLDLLFNNAGISTPPDPLEELPLDAWRSVVDINLTGAFLCAQQAFRQMKTQRPMGGRIINNGSISAQVPRPHSIAYTATKHAVTGLTKSLSLDGRKYNIACGQIDIGNAASSMTEKMAAGVPQADGSTATEPTMNVDAVAQAVLYMARLPLETNVPFMTVMANQMPYIGRG